MQIELFKEAINVNPFTADGAESLNLWRQVGVNNGLALGLPDPVLGPTCKQKTEKQVFYHMEDNKNIKKLIAMVGFLLDVY